MTWELRKIISLTSLGLGVIFCLVSFIAADRYSPAVLGIVFGTLISVLNFNLLAKTTEKIAGMDPQRAQMKVTVNYIIRYAIYGIVLFISIKAPYLNPIGTAAGFFTSILALYITQILQNRKKKIPREKRQGGRKTE